MDQEITTSSSSPFAARELRVANAVELQQSFLNLLTAGEAQPALRLAAKQAPAGGDPVKIEGDKNSGLGSYLLRPEAFEKALHLQIPHGDSDVHTRKIGQAMCEEFAFASCGFNSEHRRSFDFAHAVDSPFQLLIRAVTAQYPEALFVQIHGFSAEKRLAARDRQARMILSGGRKELAPLIRAALKQLDMPAAAGIFVYGHDTNDLGATHNAQNRLLQDLAKGHFLHIELSYATRVSLAEDPRERQKLFQLIEAVARGLQISSSGKELSKNALR